MNEKAFGTDEVTLMRTKQIETRFIGIVSMNIGFSNKQVQVGKAVFEGIGQLTYKEFRNIKKLLKDEKSKS